VSGNASFMSYSPVTDTAERHCQWTNFNFPRNSLQKLFEVTALICEQYYMHCLSIDCLVRSKMLGVCRMRWHAAWLRGTRSNSASAAVSYIKILRCPQTKKSNRLRSGDHAGHATGLLLPIHLLGYALFRCSHLDTEMGRGSIMHVPHVLADPEKNLLQ
jgi:hypothetical protein